MNMDVKIKEVLNKTNITHHEKYDCIINLIGLDKLIPLVPFDKEEIKKAYSKDTHLNNLSYNKWKLASGFYVIRNPKTQNEDVFMIENSHLHKLLYSIDINIFSVAECVCLLKQTARHMIGEN